MTPNELAKAACRYLDEKKAIDIKVINISKISVLADYFIICGGANRHQVQALSKNVEEQLAKEKVYPRSVEGYSSANWILMDYNDVIIHIFTQDQRLYYDLERIWTEGESISPADL